MTKLRPVHHSQLPPVEPGTEFTVSWTIQVDGDDWIDAASNALLALTGTDPIALANVFDVHANGTTVRVDLGALHGLTDGDPLAIVRG